MVDTQPPSLSSSIILEEAEVERDKKPGRDDEEEEEGRAPWISDKALEPWISMGSDGPPDSLVIWW